MKKWQDTVLTSEQLWAINDAMPPEAKYGEVFEAVAETQAKATWDAAIQEVQEQLRHHWVEYDTASAPKWVRVILSGTQQDIEALLGKPKEIK